VLDIEHATEDDFQRILRNGQFDFGTSFWCLHYAIDHEKTFANINKLLKPGGSFYFNFLGLHSLVEVNLKLAEKYPQLKASVLNQNPLFSRDENFQEKLPHILLKSGFKIDFLRFDTYDYDFETEECFRSMF
jgi:SAM-dependent methyltransferase